MKCRVCEEKAVISLPRHNASFCPEHFRSYVFKQTETAIKEYDMLNRGDKVMVCISGGKDSLVLWYLLHELGYNTTGMYIDLGIGEYSVRSKAKVEKFAEKFGLRSIIIDLKANGHSVPDVSKTSNRTDCSVCGSIKRYYFNKVAYDESFDVIATGHNLDDEAGRLLGNLLHWDMHHLNKQDAVLEPHGVMLKKKVKPLVRMTEKEMAAFAFLNGIDYIVEECPYSRGASSIAHKQALNLIDERSPNSKFYFYHQYIKNKDKFVSPVEEPNVEKTETVCKVCGFFSVHEVCSFCRLVGNNE